MENPNARRLYQLEKALDSFEKHSLRGYAGINRAVGRGRNLMANDDIEFDINPDLLVLTTVYLISTKKSFRPFDDYVTDLRLGLQPLDLNMKYMKDGVVQTVTKNDVTEDDKVQMNELKDVLTKILPDEEVRKLVLYIFASGLSGRAIEKFFVFNGNGRNGKGLLDEMMYYMLGDYCVNVSPKILTENARNQCSGNANPEKAKLNKKRYVFMKEPAKGEPLKNNEVKDITGGGEIQVVCCIFETKVRLFLTLVMECNKKPNFSEAPEKRCGAGVGHTVSILLHVG